MEDDNKKEYDFRGLPPFHHCIVCFEYMGETNPRQLCRKICCPLEDLSQDELALIRIMYLKKSPYRNMERYKKKIANLDKLDPVVTEK
jgi:hypothetical protein